MYTLCSEGSHNNFSKLFFYLISNFQYTTISYLMLTNNVLTCFDHLSCNLKHTTFPIIPPHNTSKSFPFCFTFGIANIPRSFFLCFQILLTCISLFPLLSQFQLLTNTITNIIIRLPCVFMSSRSFCPSKTLGCSFSLRSFQNILVPSTESSF